MNNVNLIGNVGEMYANSLPSGERVIKLSLAVQRSFKNVNGEYDTDWITCVLYSKTAEFIEKYCQKGYKIAVNGELRNNNWKDKEGKMHYDIIVHVDQVEVLTKKNNPNAVNQPVEQVTEGTTEGVLPF